MYQTNEQEVWMMTNEWFNVASISKRVTKLIIFSLRKRLSQYHSIIPFPNEVVVEGYIDDREIRGSDLRPGFIVSLCSHHWELSLKDSLHVLIQGGYTTSTGQDCLGQAHKHYTSQVTPGIRTM